MQVWAGPTLSVPLSTLLWALPNPRALAQFDLARSPLPDGQLHQVGRAFGANPSPTWGFADVLHSMLSSKPEAVPVDDLAQLQRRLRSQGYLPPGAVTDGTWNPESYT